MEWDDADSALLTVVRGSGGALYDTAAFFDPQPGGLEFSFGECTCPVGIDCKHVVAAVVTAAGAAPGTPTVEAPSSPWERTLGALLTIEPPAAD